MKVKGKKKGNGKDLEGKKAHRQDAHSHAVNFGIIASFDFLDTTANHADGNITIVSCTRDDEE